MLGRAKPRRLDEPIAVSLEELVPPSNFYRHLEAQLDLSFVRGWTRECYAERGHPSIDPVVFFKLQLVMFFGGLRSEARKRSAVCRQSQPADRDSRWVRATSTASAACILTACFKTRICGINCDPAN